jgi:hypothetical protein
MQDVTGATAAPVTGARAARENNDESAAAAA